MCHLFVAPLVPADHSDPQNFHRGRLNQSQQGLHIAAAGPRTILVDDDFATLLRESRASRNQKGVDYKRSFYIPHQKPCAPMSSVAMSLFPSAVLLSGTKR